MYQLIKRLCLTPNRASGPGIDPETFFTNPNVNEDCIEYVTMVPRKDFSLHVSELLDRLGYNYYMIKYRQQIFDTYGRNINRHRNAVDRIFTGGKSEGTALFFESDIDSMCVAKNVICSDRPEDFSHKHAITLFHTERQETSPGYTRLKMLKFKGKYFVNVIRQSLFQSETGSHYLSSQFFNDVIMRNDRENLSRLGMTTDDTSGPSVPGSNKYINEDTVTCFRCICPDILERWVLRPRFHGWPSQDTIHEISLLDGHAVPVGFKGSLSMYREWRICYSLAELHLMQTFNETQLKVYILLKKICKSVLNPVCLDMTSYIMKNVVFWMCEANGVDRFTQNMLMDRLFDCIKYLRTCVSENNLPSYMIPERNLFAGRLDIQQRQQLTSLLGDLLHERGRMLLRCKKLRDAMIVMYMVPDMLREFGEKRDMLERMVLIAVSKVGEHYRPGMSLNELVRLLAQNKQSYGMLTHIHILMQFDAQQLRQMGKTDKEIGDLLLTRLAQLVS